MRSLQSRWQESHVRRCLFSGFPQMPNPDILLGQRPLLLLLQHEYTGSSLDPRICRGENSTLPPPLWPELASLLLIFNNYLFEHLRNSALKAGNKPGSELPLAVTKQAMNKVGLEGGICAVVVPLRKDRTQVVIEPCTTPRCDGTDLRHNGRKDPSDDISL